MTEWLSKWPTDWLIENFTDFLIYWLTDWLNDWMTDWLTYWLIILLFHWQTDWLNDWMTEWLTHWLTDWMNIVHLFLPCLLKRLSFSSHSKTFIWHAKMIAKVAFNWYLKKKSFILSQSVRFCFNIKQEIHPFFVLKIFVYL